MPSNTVPSAPVDRPSPPEEVEHVVAILVLGTSKSGKSQFINWILESEYAGHGEQRATVGKRLASTTRKVQQVELPKLSSTYPSRKIILVDTPGLGHTYMSDIEVLTEIAQWLSASYHQGVTVGAVVYLQNIFFDKITPAMQSDIEILKRLGGEQVVPQGMVTIATTKWSRVQTPEEGEANEEQVRKELWRGLVEAGHAVPRVTDATSAVSLLKKVVEGMGGTGDLPAEPQVQREPVDFGRLLAETEAGRYLSGQPMPAGELNERFRMYRGPDGTAAKEGTGADTTAPSQGRARERWAARLKMAIIELLEKHLLRKYKGAGEPVINGAGAAPVEKGSSVVPTSGGVSELSRRGEDTAPAQGTRLIKRKSERKNLKSR